MADGDVSADAEGEAGVDVQHRAVLDVAPGADADQVVVGAHDDVEPDARPLLDDHRAEQGRVGGDERFAEKLSYNFV